MLFSGRGVRVATTTRRFVGSARKADSHLAPLASNMYSHRNEKRTSERILESDWRSHEGTYIMEEMLLHTLKTARLMISRVYRIRMVDFTRTIVSLFHLFEHRAGRDETF